MVNLVALKKVSPNGREGPGRILEEHLSHPGHCGNVKKKWNSLPSLPSDRLEVKIINFGSFCLFKNEKPFA